MDGWVSGGMIWDGGRAGKRCVYVNNGNVGGGHKYLAASPRTDAQYFTHVHEPNAILDTSLGATAPAPCASSP